MRFKSFLLVSLFALLPYSSAFAEICSVDPTLPDNPGDEIPVDKTNKTLRDYLTIFSTLVLDGGTKLKSLADECLVTNSSDGSKTRKLIFTQSGGIDLLAPLPGLVVPQGEKLVIEVAKGQNVILNGLAVQGESANVKSDCGLYIGKSHEYFPDYSSASQNYLNQYYTADSFEIRGSLIVMNFPGHGICVEGNSNYFGSVVSLANKQDGFYVTGSGNHFYGTVSWSNQGYGYELLGENNILGYISNVNNNTETPASAVENGKSGVYVEGNGSQIVHASIRDNYAYGVFVKSGVNQVELSHTSAWGNKKGEGGAGIYFEDANVNNGMQAPSSVTLTIDADNNLGGILEVAGLDPAKVYQMDIYIAQSANLAMDVPTQARYWVSERTLSKTDSLINGNRHKFVVLGDEIKKAMGSQYSTTQDLYFTFLVTDEDGNSSVYSNAFRLPKNPDPTPPIIIYPYLSDLISILTNPTFWAAIDEDGDGTITTLDNCPSIANADQLDTDGDKAGDACDADDDNDGVNDGEDNCPLMGNPFQEDADGDGAGAVCDPDDGNVLVDDDQDDDGVKDAVDTCPNVANADQADVDQDGEGDLCDDNDTIKDNDSDGVEDSKDNCPSLANPDQTDSDGDGTGDVCEPVITPTPTPVATPTSTPTPTTEPSPTPTPVAPISGPLVSSCPDGQVLQGGQCVTPVIVINPPTDNSGGCSLQPNFEAGASPWLFKGLIALWVGLLYLMRRDLKAKNLRKI